MAGRENPYFTGTPIAPPRCFFFSKHPSSCGGWSRAPFVVAGSCVPVSHPRSSRRTIAVRSDRDGSKSIHRSQTMTTQATPNNPLMNGISDATKARVIESLFPNSQICYADEITHNLTRVKRVLTGLSKLGAQDEGDDQITGELTMALSELLEQQVDIAIILLQGSVFDQSKPNNI